MHEEGAEHSLADYNRAGVPLLEIVSEPDMDSGAAAAAYGAEIRRIVRFLGVSNGNMQARPLPSARPPLPVPSHSRPPRLLPIIQFLHILVSAFTSKSIRRPAVSGFCPASPSVLPLPSVLVVLCTEAASRHVRRR